MQRRFHFAVRPKLDSGGGRHRFKTLTIGKVRLMIQSEVETNNASDSQKLLLELR